MEQLGVIQDPMAYQGSARRYRADSCAVGSRPVTAVGKHSNWSHSEDPSSTQKSWNFTANRSNGRMIHPWKYMGNIQKKHVVNCMIWIMNVNFFYLHRLHRNYRNQPSPAHLQSQISPFLVILEVTQIVPRFLWVFRQCSHSVEPFHGVCFSDGLAWQKFWEISPRRGIRSFPGFQTLRSFNTTWIQTD